MASFTLKGGQTFPEGTSVGAYPRTAWPSYQNPTGAPSGAATASGTVTNNQVTFTGLADNTQYVAYASTPDRYKSFYTATSPTAGRFRGAWAASTAYSQGDLVTQGGVLYSANADFTSGGSFSAANWTSAGPTTSLAVLAADVGPIASQTTLQDITGLGLSIGASSTEVHRVTWWLLVAADNATMDAKFSVTAPAGCAVRWATLGGLSTEVAAWGARATAQTQLVVLNQAGAIALGTVAGTVAMAFTGIVMGGGTAGTVQIQYAQNTSDVGNLKILKGSLMEAVKVAA